MCGRQDINESNRQGGKPLYHAIVKRMRQEGLTGITEIRGVEMVKYTPAVASNVPSSTRS
ncbi:MAG: DUF190 domain-containing protein [Firmicutes bacterium]|nr:DUF190 domain-containing protein [Bacillota bacterium]